MRLGDGLAGLDFRCDELGLWAISPKPERNGPRDGKRECPGCQKAKWQVDVLVVHDIGQFLLPRPTATGHLVT
jgi:hypothetical protein